ncbi:MAG: chemotaxis response regulator protein-glutamate methylesterase, partial [Planctomycetota bacterium]|nr:chemotaxis response regulator protein-glutamate methylesterase [Planctomycetota bacterium]
VLFRSAAEAAGRHAVGVLLTGMGSDGAIGLQAIRAVGGTTIAQDEATSVVYGMPRAAVELGVVDRIAALETIPAAVIDALTAAAPRGRAENTSP